MSYSLLKLKSKRTGAIVYDYINDACETHNLYDSKLNETFSFDYDEWMDVCCRYDEVDMSQEEADRVWNDIRTKIRNELNL
jgi:hypothetical protein